MTSHPATPNTSQPEIDQYDFELPRNLIAQHPLATRTDSRLMIVDRDSQTIVHRHFRDLPTVLRAGDAIVLNDTRVILAQLVGHRTQTRGRWHGLFLSTESDGNWRLLSKTRGRIRPGETVTLQDRDGRAQFELLMIQNIGEGQWLARPMIEGDAAEILADIGRVPLPNYIRAGNMVDADIADYQTVFASQPGAVAAPTAGLHFTPQLLQQLAGMGIQVCRVTLHVGIDTFRPVSAGNLAEHRMHSEWGTLTEQTAERLNRVRDEGGRIVAIGTTSVRVLETAHQDDRLIPWTGQTEIFIRPPYRFRSVDALCTNFHLPRSTLIILVRTFGGDELIREAYQQAICEEYRFFSYGDAMIIL